MILSFDYFYKSISFKMDNTAIIVDDEQDGLDSLERLLGFCNNIKIVGKANTVEKAIQQITTKKPDILFLDIEMPRMSGFEVLEVINKQGLNPIVIFTTGYDQYAMKAIKKQAFDYLLKPIILDELKETINRLFQIQNGFHKPEFSAHITKLLSPREIEILGMITQGKTSKEIALEFYISKTTVDTHRRNILEKTGTRSTAELISRLIR